MSRSVMSAALVNTELTLARHETFHIRDGWLSKGLHALDLDPLALSRKGAHNRLGVGKNMLTSIRYWVQATGLAEPAGKRIGGRQPLRLSRVGAALSEHDHFLEDAASLWVAHIGLASNQALATLWYWAFNEFDEPAFNDGDLFEGFVRYAESRGITDLNENSIKKDVNVFIRTYKGSDSTAQSLALEDRLDCPFVSLGLVEAAVGAKPMAFRVGTKVGLMPAVVGYAALRFRDANRSTSEIVSLDELRWAPNSPGRLLQLDSRSLVDSLQIVEEQTNGRWFRVSRTSGLGNVHFNQVDPVEALRWHYVVEDNEAL